MLIKEWVLEQAVSGGESVVQAPGHGAVREDEPPQELEVMAAERVADVDWATVDGPGGGMEGGAGVVRLEHVPVRADELAHPQAVVGAVHHVGTLQPVHAVRRKSKK